MRAPLALTGTSLATRHSPRATFFYLCSSVFICVSLFSPSAAATIRYTISLEQPDQHLFRVTMTVPEVRESLTVAMPAWNALYQIRDFSHRVGEVRAVDAAGSALPIAKLDKQTWRLSASGNVTLTYSIFWDEPGPFASQLNSSHAFLNLATLLFYIPDRRAEDVSIAFPGVPAAWRIAVALKPSSNASSSFVAATYDALVDAPVEIGPFTEFRLDSLTPPVRVVVHGENFDRSALADALHRIVVYQTGLMGGSPYDEFLFIYHYGPSALVGGGGMEHSNSTAISSHTLPAAISVGAHEFFHLWNVKRLRPASLEPVDYSHEQFTRSLWFAEGVTSAYGSYTLVRTGLWTPRQFYDDLAGEITALESRPARTWQSVEQASLDAWLEKNPLYGRPEFSISYYNKGQILGVLLDILLRDLSDNRASLDDVLRYLNDNFARRNRPYGDTDDILAASRAVLTHVLRAHLAASSRDVILRPRLGRGRRISATNSISNISLFEISNLKFEISASPDPLFTLDSFFARYVSGTDPLDYATYLSKAGLKLTPRARPTPKSSTQPLVYDIAELPNPTDRQRRIRDGLLRGTFDSGRP